MTLGMQLRSLAVATMAAACCSEWTWAQPEKTALLAQWSGLETASNSGADRIAIADAMVTEATKRRSKKQSFYSDLLREAARVYEENGAVAQAVGAFGQENGRFAAVIHDRH